MEVQIWNWYCPICDKNLSSQDVLGLSEGSATHKICKTLVVRKGVVLQPLGLAREVSHVQVSDGDE